MMEIKIEIPKELEEEIKSISKTTLSLIINKLIKEELEEMIRLKKIVSKSKMKERDVEELTNKIDEVISKKFLDAEQNANSC